MADMIPELSEAPKDEIKKPGSTSSSTETKKEREPANFWLNVGVVRKNADGVEKLVTLPMGIPLDKLKAKPVPKNASEFQQLRAAEAELWAQFKPFYEALKPGESKRIPFVVEVRRVSEAEKAELRLGLNPP
jgi:hypothetical protein